MKMLPIAIDKARDEENGEMIYFVDGALVEDKKEEIFLLILTLINKSSHPVESFKVRHNLVLYGEPYWTTELTKLRRLVKKLRS